MRKKKKAKNQGEAAKLEMTPMIDVVFQLLIFFIVTLKQEDILSHLDISRPAAEKTITEKEPENKLLEILVYNPRALGGQGFSLRGRKISRKTLDRHLTRLAKFSKTISIIIKCTSNSPDAKLIQLLDICSKAGLKNISVFSM